MRPATTPRLHWYCPARRRLPLQFDAPRFVYPQLTRDVLSENRMRSVLVMLSAPCYRVRPPPDVVVPTRLGVHEMSSRATARCAGADDAPLQGVLVLQWKGQ